MIIIMGDLNAKIGKEQDPLNVTVGPHGLGERNERGDLWTEWCSTHDQVILNTWFQHHQKHPYTWKSPGDGTSNQIDYITINERFRNSVTQDCGSDHNKIMATVRVKLRKLMRNNSQPKLQTDLKMSIDRNSVNKCQHVCLTWLEQTKWKHDTQNSAIYLLKRLNK